jgi:hypothetical protein
LFHGNLEAEPPEPEEEFFADLLVLLGLVVLERIDGERELPFFF